MEELYAELEGLEAILMNDVVIQSPDVFTKKIEFRLENCSFSVEVKGKLLTCVYSYVVTYPVSLVDSYHSEIPVIEVSTDYTSHVHIDGNALRKQLQKTVQNCLQEEYLFLLYQAAQDWIKDNAEVASSDDSAATKRPVCKFFLEGRCRFNEKCFNFHPGSQAGKVANAEKMSHQPQTTKVNTNTEEVTKKPPMRTATDVISRIQWDPELTESDFVIGYTDRFIGIIERHFSDFNWEDIATVDIDVLAIPKHRIQYFKYKREIVWDRRIQFDNFFGSRGNGTTIYSYLKKDATDTRMPLQVA